MLAHKPAQIALPATLVAALVSACGDKEDDGKTVATQMAAKVTNGEISNHRINTVLQRADGSSGCVSACGPAAAAAADQQGARKRRDRAEMAMARQTCSGNGTESTDPREDLC